MTNFVYIENYIYVCAMIESGTIPQHVHRIYQQLKDKTFGIKDIKLFDINAVRPLRYWIEQGLIGEVAGGDSEASRNDKFDFFEFLWVLVVKELKELNFDNQIVRSCAIDIFSRRDTKYDMLEFEKAVLYTLVNRRDALLLISKAGKFDVYRPKDYRKIAEKTKVETCIIMNILPLVRGILFLGFFTDYVAERGLLNEQEIHALRVLNSNHHADLIVNLDGEAIHIGHDQNRVAAFADAIFNRKPKSITITL